MLKKVGGAMPVNFVSSNILMPNSNNMMWDFTKSIFGLTPIKTTPFVT